MSEFFEQLLATDQINLANTTLRLLAAALAGLLVGVEREVHMKPAGMRTYIVISVGACLLMILSVYVPQTFWRAGEGDPGRIAAQVVTGIGFLGAGAIFRLGFTVTGLTSAASIWTTAAIGLVIGAGMYYAGALAAVLLLVTLTVLEVVEHKWLRGARRRSLVVEGEIGPERMGAIMEVLDRHSVAVEQLGMTQHIDEGIFEFRGVVRVGPGFDVSRFIADLKALKGMRRVGVE